MKKIVIALALGLGLSALASPGTYTGNGVSRIPGGTDEKYITTVVVKEIAAKSIYQVDESWEKADGQKSGSSLTFHFNADGTFKVKNNGVDVGCGYSFEDKNGMWMDYRFQSPWGPVHFNQYHSKVDDTVHRLADGILNGQARFWTDTLIKK
jgi:hypothetical protein